MSEYGVLHFEFPASSSLIFEFPDAKNSAMMAENSDIWIDLSFPLVENSAMTADISDIKTNPSCRLAEKSSFNTTPGCVETLSKHY